MKIINKISIVVFDQSYEIKYILPFEQTTPLFGHSSPPN